MSTMPPRTAKSPGSTTVPVREKPFSLRNEISLSDPTRLPGAAVKVWPSIRLRGTTRCSTALTVVSRTTGCVMGWRRRERVASRRATISATGDTRS